MIYDWKDVYSKIDATSHLICDECLILQLYHSMLDTVKASFVVVGCCRLPRDVYTLYIVVQI